MSDARHEKGLMLWLKKGATHHHAQLVLPDKGHVIKRVGCLKLFGSTAFRPA